MDSVGEALEERKRHLYGTIDHARRRGVKFEKT
jgi:hypothetical protein